MSQDNLNFTDICRACKANEVELTSIFTKTTSPPIDEMLMAIVALKPEPNDGLPSQICKVCLEKVETLYAFRQQVIQNETEFKIILNQNYANLINAENVNQDISSFMRSLMVKPIDNEELSGKDNENINFTCPKCNRRFLTLQFLQDHVENGHPLTLVHECVICDVKIANREDLRTHLHLHLHDPLYSCKDCKYGFNTSEELDQHMEDCLSPIITCEICNRGFNEESSLKSHHKFHFDNSATLQAVTVADFENYGLYFRDVEYDYNDYCADDFGKNLETEAFKDTLIDEEEDEELLNIEDVEKTVNVSGKQAKFRVLQCKLCDFTCNNHMKRHLSTHLKENPYVCHKCKRTFARKDKLTKHLGVCKGNRSICEHCKRGFKDDEHVELHKISDKCDAQPKSKTISLADFKDRKRITKFYTVKVLYEDSGPPLPRTKKKDGGQEANFEVSFNDDNSNESIEQVTVEVDMPHAFDDEEELFSSEVDESDTDYRPNVKFGQKKKKKSSGRGPGRPKKIKIDYNNDQSVEESIVSPTAQSSKEKEAKQFKKKRFSCNLCGFTCTNHVKRHMATHLIDKPHVCKGCSRSFARNDKLIRHERICSGKRVILCEACNKTFDSESDLENHVTAVNEADKCQGSKRSKTITLEDYADPQRLSKFYTETVYFLDDQNEKKSSIEGQRNNDDDTLPLQVKTESDDNDVNDDVDDDMSQSDDEYIPKTKAPRAKKKKKVGRPKKKHVVEVEDEEPEPEGHHPCPVCNEVFKRLTDLEAHGKEVHVDYQVLKCPQCDSRFTRVYALKRHKRLHEVDAGGQDKEEKSHPCGRCLRKFTSSKALKFHMRKHEADDSFVCTKCSKPFTSKSNLLEHMKFHAPEKKFLCSVCGLGFIRNDYLIIHMRRHRGDKPYACKFCGKGFARQTDVKVHERYHTGEKTHLCMVCGRGFARAYSLNVHMRTHTGEKPYQCQYCDAAFAQSNDLKSHVRRHTGERFQCDLCPSNFIMGYELIQHKRKDHGLNIVGHIRRLKDSDAQQSEGPEPETVKLPKPVVARPPVIFAVNENIL